MDYFQLLNLTKEPFSNSPDPEFFYPSPEHIRCLQKLELAIRLRRGLNVVVGAIGTGKTTLCRHLIREFSADKSLETHLILNPDFSTPMEFLCSLAEQFGLTAPSLAEKNKWQVEEGIKQYLFEQGVEKDKTVVLLIDEGQKMLLFCLEILRELLNYETNEHKLLQVVIFAQEEFQQTIAEHPSFADRINTFHVLAPLSFQETRKLLQFRLNQAKEGYKEPRLFTTPGIWALYLATRGYPRKIVHLSHRVLLTMIIQNRSTAGWFLVRWCSRMMLSRKAHDLPWRPLGFGALVVALAVLAAFALNRSGTSFFDHLIDLTGIKGSASHQLDSPGEPRAARRARIPAPTKTATLHPIPSAEKPADSPPNAPQNGTASVPEAAAPFPAAQTGAAAAPSPGEPSAGEPGPPPETPAPTAPVEAPVEATRETSPPVKSETPSAEFHPPEVLGQVTARPGDNLERMIRRVYGFFDAQILKAVMQLNPQISDFNTLEAGRGVKFPPLPVRADPLPKEGRYVQVAQANTLDEACKLLRAYPNDAPPVYLLPHWNPGNGLKFGLVLKDCCPNQQSAEATLGTLSPSLAGRARIIGKEEEQAVFLVK